MASKNKGFIKNMRRQIKSGHWVTIGSTLFYTGILTFFILMQMSTGSGLEGCAMPAVNNIPRW